MTFSDYKLERVGFGLILCIALLMFFQPLVRLHGHNGSQSINAINVRYELSQLQSNLRVLATINYPSDSGASLVSEAGAPVAAKPVPIPFSLRAASLVQWFVFGALGFCLLALFGHFFFKKAVAILSLVGGCAGAIAVLHVMLMGSDLRSWTEILVNTALLSPEDPSGAIRMASAFLVSPAFGLYALTACLFLVPILSFSRAIPRVRSVARGEQRISRSQPISLRPVNSRYPEENCRSLNVSEGGLLLETSLNHYYVGMEIYLTRNAHAAGPANAEEHGSVVRVQKTQKGGCRIAIRIIPDV
ncbi:MAG: hypothetical protein DMG40_10055 [Acidobacteria bacterium]|nr:MAG: hypothetical protein DMG40_10055 [Acidobacteriota bacterium]